ncbi:MAG: hypothetical protein ACTSXJ_03550 [Candidatus Baldrarchaeia archaeon]
MESATRRSGFPAIFAATSIAQFLRSIHALWIVAGLGDALTMNGAISAVLLNVRLRRAFNAHSAARCHVSYFSGRPLRFRLVSSLGAIWIAAWMIALIALRSYISVGWFAEGCKGLWGRAAP